MHTFGGGIKVSDDEQCTEIEFKKLFFFNKLHYKSYVMQDITVTFHIYFFFYEFLRSQHCLLDEREW